LKSRQHIVPEFFQKLYFLKFTEKEQKALHADLDPSPERAQNLSALQIAQNPYATTVSYNANTGKSKQGIPAFTNENKPSAYQLETPWRSVDLKREREKASGGSPRVY